MVDLPRSWDDYLRDRLSARRREDLRRAMRAIEALPGLRDERAAPDTFEPPFEALMRLRSQRWGLDHDDEMRRLGRVLSRMLAEGAMTLRTFWDGDVLVAGIGGFPDRARGVFWYYLSAFNPDYAKLSPGKAVFGFSIRDAVEAGFRSYSFTYGDEAYKATFGAEDAFCTDMLVLRRSLRSSLVRVLLTTYLRLKRHPNP